MNRAFLEKMLTESPKLHRGETEMKRAVSAQETFLHGSALNSILQDLPGCYGIDPEVARFLYDSVSDQSKTLETGSGISTLVFALRRTDHIAITPNATEVAAIENYAHANQVPLDRVRFVIEPSDRYLPGCEIKDLDLVLIDGKHAFPWPIIDWFYTADRLKKGGILILDDLQMPSVSILKDFIAEDPRWQPVRSFGKRTLAVEKAVASVHDVAWHMQPYVIRRYGRKARLMNVLGLKGRAKP
jgi:hypothetical protein